MDLRIGTVVFIRIHVAERHGGARRRDRHRRIDAKRQSRLRIHYRGVIAGQHYSDHTRGSAHAGADGRSPSPIRRGAHSRSHHGGRGYRAELLAGGRRAALP